MHITDSFVDLLDSRFHKDYYGEYNDYPQVGNKLFTMKTSDKAYEKHTGVGAFGLVSEKGEAEDVTYDTSVQLYDKTYTHITYAKGFKTSQEMMEDDQTDAMRRRPKLLGRSVAQTRETLKAGVFNGGFADTGPDGFALFYDDHLSYGARTRDNLGTSAALSHSALITAMTRMMKMTDDRGLYISVEPSILLYPVDLIEDAYIILQTERVPGSANWDKNWLEGRGLSGMSWRYLTDVNAWFLLAPTAQREFIWYDRVMPSFNKDGDFDKDVLKHKARFRSSVGYNDWVGADGNAGA